MADNQPTPGSPEPSRNGRKSPFDAGPAFDVLGTYLHPGKENVMLIYVLYLAGLVPAFGIVPIIVGFVLAYLNRKESSGLWTSHYEYQYRQAIAGLVFLVVSVILVIVIVGFAGLVLLAVWWIIRSVKGLQAASRYEPIARPESFGW